MDELEQELGLPIQHYHLDEEKGWIGSEFSLPEWKHKRVDGYFEDVNGDKVVIEYLGDYYHGHPRYWSDDVTAIGPHHKPYKHYFEDTESKLEHMRFYGYKVYYAWECDYKKKGDCETTMSVVREFNGTLEY